MRHDRRWTNIWLSSITTICNYTATLLTRLWEWVPLTHCLHECLTTCLCAHLRLSLGFSHFVCVWEGPSGATESHLSHLKNMCVLRVQCREAQTKQSSCSTFPFSCSACTNTTNTLRVKHAVTTTCCSPGGNECWGTCGRLETKSKGRELQKREDFMTHAKNPQVTHWSQRLSGPSAVIKHSLCDGLNKLMERLGVQQLWPPDPVDVHLYLLSRRCLLVVMWCEM